MTRVYPEDVGEIRDCIENKFAPGPYRDRLLKVLEALASPADFDLRRILALRHGCPLSALYGDDGELQCNGCGLDFRRDSTDRISARFYELGIRKLASPADAGTEPNRPPQPNGCTCYGEAPTVPVYRLASVHLPNCAIYGKQPADAGTRARECCEKMREKAAKAVEWLDDGREPARIIRSLPLPTPTRTPHLDEAERRRLATALHFMFCTMGHVDQCGWDYEVAGIGAYAGTQPWANTSHKHWLGVADKFSHALAQSPSPHASPSEQSEGGDGNG